MMVSVLSVLGNEEVVGDAFRQVGGAREELYEQVRLSLDWISARIASGPPRGQARVGR